MSSSTRKISLKERLSIAAKSMAIGAVWGAAMPPLLYRMWLRDAAAEKKKAPFDWNRVAIVVQNSNLLGLLHQEFIEKDLPPPGWHDMCDECDREGGEQVH